MSHTTRDRQKLLARVRRIRGQVDAIERSLNDGKACAAVLQNIAACRGAINGLMSKVLEGHVREHILDPACEPSSAQREAAEDVIELVKTYLT